MTMNLSPYLRAFARPRAWLMLALGFSSGLPLLLVFGTLSAWLRTAGIDIEIIGLFSYLGLAYSLKFLWAPVVDAYDPPLLGRWLGRRRGWMVAAQLLVAMGLVAAALGDPARALLPTVIAAALVALGGATQDIVVDAWRIEVSPEDELGLMTAIYQLGYRFGIIAAGAGALTIADAAGWSGAYAAMAGLMVVGMAAAILAPAPAQAAPARPGFGGLWAPVADMLGRADLRLWLALAMIALYRVPDFAAGVMANPLYIDLGFTLTQVAAISKLYGVWISILGAFAGGLAVAVIGIRWSVLIGAVTASGSNLAFSWLALTGLPRLDAPRTDLLTAAISIDNFAGGFAGTALIAYMSAMTGKRFAASQYALLSSLYALPGKLVGGVSGYAVAALGYAHFFALTAAIGLPVVLLCLAVGTPPKPDEAPAAGEPDAVPLGGRA